MKITKQSMIAECEQALEDQKILEQANLGELEVMPAWRIIGSLRFLQELCHERNMSIDEITPELIIDVIKNQPRFSFQ